MICPDHADHIPFSLRVANQSCTKIVLKLLIFEVKPYPIAFHLPVCQLYIAATVSCVG